MASESGGRRWLTCTCFGCLGLILLIVLVVGGFFGTAWLGVRNENVTRQELAPELPLGAGRVDLSLVGGEFRIRPARPGEPLRVEASFDDKSFTLSERLDTEAAPWVYELELERKISSMSSLLRGVVGGSGPEFTIYLPREIPIELAVEGTQCALEVEFGGLTLTRAQFAVSQAAIEMQVSEPTQGEMELLSVASSMGAFVLERLGNASPRRLEIDTKMSGLVVDLNGEWRNDASITLRSNQGGAQLRLPRDVHLVGLETGSLTPLEDEEIRRPTLTFTVAADEIEIID